MQLAVIVSVTVIVVIAIIAAVGFVIDRSVDQ
jgi:hypothetical protein